MTSVGGTALSSSSNSRGWTKVWNTSSTEGTGSGCSAYDAKPTWQTDTSCSKRMIADVSAVADPATGVSVYDTYGDGTGWVTYGGTSASSPIIAAVYALAGTPSSGSYPAQFPYGSARTSALNDVTSGSNGSCSTSYFCTAQVRATTARPAGAPGGCRPSPADRITLRTARSRRATGLRVGIHRRRRRAAAACRGPFVITSTRSETW